MLPIHRFFVPARRDLGMLRIRLR